MSRAIPRSVVEHYLATGTAPLALLKRAWTLLGHIEAGRWSEAKSAAKQIAAWSDDLRYEARLAQRRRRGKAPPRKRSRSRFAHVTSYRPRS